MAHGSTRRPQRRGTRAPVGQDVDRINDIANGLTEASLALTADDTEAARRAVDETLARATAYLSEVVTQGEARARRRRRSWSTGVASAAVVAAGFTFAGPAVLDSLAPGRDGQDVALPRPPAADPARHAAQPDADRVPESIEAVVIRPDEKAKQDRVAVRTVAQRPPVDPSAPPDALPPGEESPPPPREVVAVVPPPPPVPADDDETAPPPSETHPSLLASTSGKPADQAQLNWTRHTERPGRGKPAGGIDA